VNGAFSVSENRILVIGGGISGMTAAIEAAEVGREVILVEKEPYLGGQVIRMNQYFPKMCPPTCGMEINFRRIRQNPRITVYAMAEVQRVSGRAGSYDVTIQVRPRYVTGRYALDYSHAESVASERDNEFNYGMDKSKALYLPHEMAYPMRFVVDDRALSAAERQQLPGKLPEAAVDMQMSPQQIEVKVGAIIVATGWKPYDATKIDNLGFGKVPNVITNMMMERLAAVNGPTKGQIVRPSDGQPPTKVAFVQCAGSRDEKHLPYCSAVCCMASLKHARYVREKCPEAKVTIFYIDIRTVGRLEKFYYDLLTDENISFVKGKVAGITEDAATHTPVVEVEDTLGGAKITEPFDLVVLATGIVPATAETKLPLDLTYDDYGFVVNGTKTDSIFAVGCAKRPAYVARSVRDATGGALKAIQTLRGG
jgi:quinone-modifying oxidoreductase subunit QmoA